MAETRFFPMAAIQKVYTASAYTYVYISVAVAGIGTVYGLTRNAADNDSSSGNRTTSGPLTGDTWFWMEPGDELWTGLQIGFVPVGPPANVSFLFCPVGV